MYREHLKWDDSENHRLYRIFVYDCPPLSKRAHYPITRNPIDFGKTSTATWRLAFHEELKKLRKVALRLGYLNERYGQWRLHPDTLKALIAKQIVIDSLVDKDFKYDVQQKGVDMRIGLDIG